MLCSYCEMLQIEVLCPKLSLVNIVIYHGIFCLNYKKLDAKYTRMLHAVLNKFWKQHPIKQQIYDRSPPISNRYELISDLLQWTPTHEFTSASRPTKSYIHQLCGHWMLYRGPAKSDDQQGKMAKRSERNLCYQHNVMMKIVSN